MDGRVTADSSACATTGYSYVLRGNDRGEVLSQARMHTVTGATGYTGRYIRRTASQAGEQGAVHHRTPRPGEPLRGPGRAAPLRLRPTPGAGGDPPGNRHPLQHLLDGPVNHGGRTHEECVRQTRVMFEAARKAGVRRHRPREHHQSRLPGDSEPTSGARDSSRRNCRAWTGYPTRSSGPPSSSAPRTSPEQHRLDAAEIPGGLPTREGGVRHPARLHRGPSGAGRPGGSAGERHRHRRRGPRGLQLRPDGAAHPKQDRGPRRNPSHARRRHLPDRQGPGNDAGGHRA